MKKITFPVGTVPAGVVEPTRLSFSAPIISSSAKLGANRDDGFCPIPTHKEGGEKEGGGEGGN